MVTTYGSFPGVRVEVSGGGISAISIGAEEKLVIFGEPNYASDETLRDEGIEDTLETGLTGSFETAETINGQLEPDNLFGSGSELADAMKEALGNGANIDYLYGVAPRRFNVRDEVQSTQSGLGDNGLNNAPIWEEDVEDESNLQAIEVEDDGGGTIDHVEYTYGEPTQPSSEETMVINPLTGEYQADAAPDGDYLFDYKYLDWESAFNATDVGNVINEDETGVFAAVSDSPVVSSLLDSAVKTKRENFKLINGITGATPNDAEVVTTDGASLTTDHANYLRRDAHYDTGSFTADPAVDSDHHFKLAPVRELNTAKTVLGGVGGLFAGNPISDPIYNDALSGYSDLEQSLTKSDADNLRGENVIPIRSAGSIRVKDNRSTSTEDDWERDFWRRRIADRVILITKQVGDAIIGRINDEQTRTVAERTIRLELQDLVDNRLLKPNAEGEQNWFVDVYESSTDSDEVKIDVGFTPYGIVKRIDESVTINA